MDEFIACFSEVCDPRQENVRHNLHEVLMIALCTMLCGGEDCSDMEAFGHAKLPFLRRFPRLKNGIPKFLAMLSLKGRIVTADAMSCQRAICAQIVEQGGDYATAPKGNQSTLHDDVRLFLEDPDRRVCNRYRLASCPA